MNFRPDTPQSAAQAQQIAQNVVPGTTSLRNIVAMQQMKPQQVGQVQNPTMNIPSNNPAAANISGGQPVLQFFGGYSTSPADQGAQPPASTVAVPPSAIDQPGDNAPHVQTQATVASNVSFRSLHPGRNPRL